MTIAKIQVRRGTSAEWAAANPILDAGEPGYDTTTGQVRYGNGVARWASLSPFYPGVTGGGSGGGGAAAITIASAISPPAVQARADYVCNGTNDAATINAAIVAASNAMLGGTLGDRAGSILLADGVYVLNGPILIPARGFTIAGQGYGTVLMKAASFTDAGRGASPALIKMADTTRSNGAGQIQIRDLHLWGNNRSAFGSGGSTGSSRVGGIHLEVAGSSNDADSGGLPIGGPNEADNWSSITRVRAHAVTTGIYWTSSNGMRGVSVTDCAAHNLADGGAALHVNASDSRIVGWKSGSGGAANATGIRAAGGNTVLVGCKTSYFNATGGIGMDISSSRCLLSGCEAQDNRTGIAVSAVHAILSGIRIDNQEPGMSTGLDMTGATTFMVDGLMVQTRGSGEYVHGINLPNSSTYGFIDAIVDPGGAITNAVSKGGTAVTASGDLPANLEARILRGGSSTLRRER
jgi:hypothetical protein